jgi:tetratricopeptide (TPR) repeat protein
MPGAFAYHLHSFSAQTLRSTNQNWVGPLLAKGATITMGCVDEPYHVGTPNVAAFLERFLAGFSFGEAAYAAQHWLSWQTTFVGDPLYRPYTKSAETLHVELQNRQSKLIEWACLRAVDLQQARGSEPDRLVSLLGKIPYTRESALLQEKLGDIYWTEKRFTDALDTYDQSLRLESSRPQTLRLLLKVAEKRARFGPDRAMFQIYERIVREFPEYPDLLSIYQKLLPLAQKLDNKEEVQRCQQEIKKLLPPAPAPATKP